MLQLFGCLAEGFLLNMQKQIYYDLAAPFLDQYITLI